MRLAFVCRHSYAVAVLAVLLCGPASRGALILRLEQAGFATLEVQDNGPQDADPTLGALTFSGSYNEFQVAASGRSTSGIAGPEAVIEITTSVTLDMAAPGESRLGLALGDTDFSVMGGAGQIASELSGTRSGGGSVTFQSFADPFNVLFARTTGTNGLFSSDPAFTLATAEAFGDPDLFSLDNQSTVVLAPAATASFTGTTRASVPEPAPIAVLGVLALRLLSRLRFHTTPRRCS